MDVQNSWVIISLSCLSLSFSRERFSRDFQLLISTPYKLELTLEVLKLHRVISVSGIQYSRIDYMGGSYVHAVCRCDNLISLIYARTHAMCISPVEFCQRKSYTGSFQCVKVTDRSYFCDSHKALEIVYLRHIGCRFCFAFSNAHKVTRPALCHYY